MPEGSPAEPTGRAWRRADRYHRVAAIILDLEPLETGLTFSNAGNDLDTFLTLDGPSLRNPQGLTGRITSQVALGAREEIFVQPSTIFCRILQVQPSTVAPGCYWAVTVVDRQGVMVTVDHAAKELQTYKRFQAAILRATGSPFRYLPVEPQAAPTQTSPAPELSVAAAMRKGSVQVVAALRVGAHQVSRLHAPPV
jgi:uncharacterized protein YbjT (DUF2867 family)